MISFKQSLQEIQDIIKLDIEDFSGRSLIVQLADIWFVGTGNTLKEKLVSLLIQLQTGPFSSFQKDQLSFLEATIRHNEVYT
jgi:hypothetical protein